MGQINAEWQVVKSLRDHKGEKIGYQFWAECGYERNFFNNYFADSYGAAVYSLQHHQCPVSRTRSTLIDRVSVKVETPKCTCLGTLIPTWCALHNAY